MMDRERLATLVGESLTKQLRMNRFWSNDGQPGVRVKLLADAVAEDLERAGAGVPGQCGQPCCAERLATG